MDNLNTVPYVSSGIHFNLFDSLYVKAYGTALYNQKIIPWEKQGLVLRFNLLSIFAILFTGCAAIDDTALSTGNRPNEWGNG